jgi:hypothetical protein
MATIRQKKAFDKTLENGGNVSKAMKESGYTDAMAKNPHKLTNSDGWKELMNEYLPDDLLAKKHQQFITEGNLDSTTLKAVDMGYKLKARYPQTNNIQAVQVNINDDREKFK